MEEHQTAYFCSEQFNGIFSLLLVFVRYVRKGDRMPICWAVLLEEPELDADIWKLLGRSLLVVDLFTITILVLAAFLHPELLNALQ